MCQSPRGNKEVADPSPILVGVNKDVADPSPILVGVIDAYDIDVHANDELDLSDIPPSGEIDVSSSLQTDFRVAGVQCEEYSIDAPSTVADVFRRAMRRLNTLFEH